jgi:putative DNA methylase
MAVAVDRHDGRSYLSPDSILSGPLVERPAEAPAIKIPDGALGFRVQLYGMTEWADIYTNRQLVMLGAFADAVREMPAWVAEDGGDEIQAKAMASVLGLCVSKLAMSNSTQVRWRIRSVESKAEPAFGRHALPMVWDFAEANPFGGSVGSWLGQLKSVSTGLHSLPLEARASVTFCSDARVAGE